MIFVGVAILIAGLLALVVSADAGSLVGLDQAQTGQLLGLVLVLILVAGGAFGRRQKVSELVGNALAWMSIFVVVLVGYTYRDNLVVVADRVFGELMPGRTVVASEGGVVQIRRSFRGAFQLEAEVNGARTDLIFDTGASAVVLTRGDAMAAGINIETLRYSISVQTANGTGRAAPIRLREIAIGPIVRRNVPAFVAEDGALVTSLLGISFLETLDGYAVSRDTLELRD